MPAAPLISVVIPCYNQAHFLRDAIASVWASSIRDVEVVVIDDGSTDDPTAVAASFVGTRCIRQANAGLAGARNRGLMESGGEFLVFLDADDCLPPAALDIGAAELAARPKAAFVFGRCRMMSPDGEPLSGPDQPRIERNHYRELLKRNYIWMPAMAMFRRNAVERVGGFDAMLNAAADYGLYLRITRTNPVHDHGQLVAYYRQHAANVSGNAARLLQQTLAVLRRERPFVQGDRALLAAYYEGWRNLQNLHGTHLVDEISGDVRSGQWTRAGRKAAVLAWLHPQGLGQHAFQKIRLGRRPRASAS